MQILYDADADLSLLTQRRVAILGYGNQGHAHALNLRDAGVKEIVVATGPTSAERARQEGFTVVGNAEAAGWADLIMVLAPDEDQAPIYAEAMAPHLREGAAVAFAHGLNVHFGLIKPRPDLDVILIAPKGPGRALRSAYVRGGGMLALTAVHQDATGNARALALAYASGIGCGRAGIIETSFREECETDLFGEQAVLCGGISSLVIAAFDTLVAGGYAPELAYLECAHEVKLIADLMHERGIAGMREAISNTAEFGDYETGARIVTDETRAEMKRVLDDIQRGRFVQRFIADMRAGGPQMTAARQLQRAHPIEKVGAELRALMPWLDGRWPGND